MKLDPLPTATRLTRQFYENYDTVSLARALLGQKLVTAFRGVETAGMIVEVEAYLGKEDPACHAARGMTERNRVMFRSPGYCYVYLIYGMYHCVNVVSDPEGVGSAVLIRAVEPLSGIDVMRRRRSMSRAARDIDIARGPGRLCDALGIVRGWSGEHFADSSKIWIEPYQRVSSAGIGITGRIGISAGGDMPLRFFIAESRFVSRAPSKVGASRAGRRS
jgi:DNA-3-methyladenine glycosylase